MDVNKAQPSQIPLPVVNSRPAGGRAASADNVRANTEVKIPEPSVVPQESSTPEKEINITPQQAEEARFEAIQQAARAYADIYAVSDVKFTIYRGPTGEYITRYTNLQTGEVRQIPEQDLLELLASRGGSEGVLLNTQA